MTAKVALAFHRWMALFRSVEITHAPKPPQKSYKGVVETALHYFTRKENSLAGLPQSCFPPAQPVPYGGFPRRLRCFPTASPFVDQSQDPKRS